MPRRVDQLLSEALQANRELRNQIEAGLHPLREQLHAAVVERDRLAERVRKLELECKYAYEAFTNIAALTMVRAGKLP